MSRAGGENCRPILFMIVFSIAEGKKYENRPASRKGSRPVCLELFDCMIIPQRVHDSGFHFRVCLGDAEARHLPNAYGLN